MFMQQIHVSIVVNGFLPDRLDGLEEILLSSRNLNIQSDLNDILLTIFSRNISINKSFFL